MVLRFESHLDGPVIQLRQGLGERGSSLPFLAQAQGVQPIRGDDLKTLARMLNVCSSPRQRFFRPDLAVKPLKRLKKNRNLSCGRSDR